MKRTSRALAFGLVVAAVAISIPAGASAEEPGGLFGQLEGTVSVFNDVPDRGLFAPGLGYGGRLGYRSGRWGGFLHVGHSMWIANATDSDFELGVLNTGGGGEVRFLDDRVRSSLTLGMSTLLFDAALDEAGSKGWYLNVKPIGLRWSLFEDVTIELNPLSFIVMRPDVEGSARLTRVEYQTTLALEFQ